ncbi:MAG: transglycosylase domain-containing protein [Myxococcota bacterium]|nr:transglycosylase domain-containing protein [Myxococcota bacterium]
MGQTVSPKRSATKSSEAPTPRKAAPPPSKPTKKPQKKRSPPSKPPKKKRSPPGKPPKKRRSFFLAAAVLTLLGTLIGAGAGAGIWWKYSQDLPTIDILQSYRPPTVTVVYDRNGKLLGEIYEKRRYVLPKEQLFPVREVAASETDECLSECQAEGLQPEQCSCHIPRHVMDVFIAAEDANFWEHNGVDYEGILRAIGRNLAQGKKAQGASTITQQVARNFLLTNEKTYERKIREIILSGRVEETFDKEHILYLYLNQIYLGSGAYGIEAAARTYFGKPAYQMTLAEAAILAGLPQRPSDYSPHQNWDKARNRQGYVLGQMLKKGYIDQATHDAARIEPVNIVKRSNEFLLQAPYFTEHVRRYLVETYGFNKVYNDGLVVTATCDLDLQKAAQEAVVNNVTLADNLRGWRGAAETLEEERIASWLAEKETGLVETEARATLTVGPDDVGGYGKPPVKSTLLVGQQYTATVLEVEERHAIIGIGAHKAILPRSWAKWTYTVNPERSYRYRSQDDLSNALKRGDIVTVTVEHLDSAEAENLKGYSPAAGLPAVKLYQSPLLQGAMFSYRLTDGAVLAMVGGVDFEDSEYNRAIQARRQVGSTFKPIVYAAAIASRKFTPGTLVQDAPTVFATLNNQLWKPGNYGGDYLGNITLRRALQMSRNVVTVRILDKLGLDPVYDLAGPKLRIGYNEPSCSRTHIPSTEECVGTTTSSTVPGMVWCEYCDATSCPLVESEVPRIWKGGEQIPVGDAKQCLDEPVEQAGRNWCHSCDVNLRVCDWLPLEQIPETDPCVDARQDGDGQIWCRTCDLSMGLGSSSLTMVELSRAYSAFATYGTLVEPHFIESVAERDGTIIEAYEPPAEWPQVLDPSVAGIAHWLLREVATGGTGARTNRLGIHVAGKTGTTNDFFDAWFVGYNPDVITAAWVGFDTPTSIGVSFTGGKTALPIWMDYMKVAAPKEQDRPFPAIPGVVTVSIDESTGKVANGGRSMPMLRGTVPQNVVGDIGQTTAEDLLSEGF